MSYNIQDTGCPNRSTMGIIYRPADTTGQEYISLDHYKAHVLQKVTFASMIALAAYYFYKQWTTAIQTRKHREEKSDLDNGEALQ